MPSLLVPPISEKLNPKLSASAWRWIDFIREDSQEAMSRDEKLFQQVKLELSPPLCRFFSWKRPTLSYGRVQGINEKSLILAKKNNWQPVRRPTGGGLVLHNQDLCFTLIWRKEREIIPWNILNSYNKIHEWIQISLKEMGISTTFKPAQGTNLCDSMQNESANQSWCFQSPVCYDLISENKKIVGGAQWREGKSAIHQGSIAIPVSQSSLSLFKETFKSIFKVSLT